MKTFLLFVVFHSVDCTVYGDCPRPTLGPNMELVTDTTFPVPEGTMLNLDCEVGYRRVGPRWIVCYQGQWTKINMKCEKRNCESAGEVLNGHVDYSQRTEFGAFATVVCNEGYAPVGTVKVFCGVNGWMDRLAECKAVVCETPNSIANGYFSPVKDEYQHAEVIMYGCNGEYVPNGPKIATCENRQFNPAPPTCVLVNCPDPRVENGVVAGGARPPYKYMSSVTFRCNVGYNMEGRDTVFCDINSKWSPALPKCNPVESRVPEIANGDVEDGPRRTYKFSEKITVKCSEGYKLIGQSTLTCGERNQWSSAVPQCIKRNCGSAGEVINGYVDYSQGTEFGALASVVCSDGYAPIGTVKTYCGVNGWMDRLGECEVDLCGTPDSIANGYFSPVKDEYQYSEVIAYSCNGEYVLNGSRTAICKNREFKPVPPTCVLVNCPDPRVENGALAGGARPPYKYMSSVTFRCNTGHNMEGQDTVSCDVNSKWSPALPKCNPVECKAPEITNGAVEA